MLQLETKEQIDDVLRTAQQSLVVVDIFADWCQPCKYLAPQLEQLAVQYPQVLFCKVNIERTRHKQISGLPTIEFWQGPPGNKTLKETVLGADLAKIKALLGKPGPPSSKRPTGQATALPSVPKPVPKSRDGGRYKSYRDL